ncbi:carbohydrate kinase [Glycomyces sp. NPDC046736]|uniref:carbohydrate kinase family protein n=1 Tax=Glycomyces sp. NPDC046736 TaxID=3155615 RepID=UPI0033C3277A
MITVVGEALLDLVAGGDTTRFDARPGGSPANVAVGLARLGTPVALATRLADDLPGRIIAGHLEANGVRVERLPGDTDRTSLALAAIGADGGADYSFHLSWDPTAMPDLPKDCACLHTGSLATALEPGASAVEALLDRARQTGVPISYDPNVRPMLLGDRKTERERVERHVAGADVVKVSEEDLAWLYPGETPQGIARKWATSGPSLVVLTRGARGATGFNTATEVEVKAPKVTVKDTVGAGDAFTAALLDSLTRTDLLRPGLTDLDPESLTPHLTFAAKVAAITCERTGAEPPTRAELLD